MKIYQTFFNQALIVNKICQYLIYVLDAQQNAKSAEQEVTSCNKSIIDLEEALDEEQETLNSTLERLEGAEKVMYQFFSSNKKITI